MCKFEMYVHLHIRSFNLNFWYMGSRIHTYDLQCSHASVGLAQARPNHTSNSHECMGVNGEALQLHADYKKPHFSHVRILICTTNQVHHV